MTYKILRRPETEHKTGLTRSQLYAAIAAGQFPKPVKLGSNPNARAVGWIESEVDSWIIERIKAR